MELFTNQSRYSINQINFDQAIINKEDSLEWNLQVSKKQAVFNIDSKTQKKIQQEKEKRMDQIQRQTKYAIQKKIGINEEPNERERGRSESQSKKISNDSKKTASEKINYSNDNKQFEKQNKHQDKNFVKINKSSLNKSLDNQPRNNISDIDFNQINENYIKDPNNLTKINNIKSLSNIDILDFELTNCKSNTYTNNEYLKKPVDKTSINPQQSTERNQFKHQHIMKSPRIMSEITKYDNDKFKLIKHAGILCSAIDRYSDDLGYQQKNCDQIKIQKNAINSQQDQKRVSLFCERRLIDIERDKGNFKISLSQSVLV